MILPNNPQINVDELMRRVRADANAIRASGAVEQRRALPLPLAPTDDTTLTSTLDRHRGVTAVLNRAEKENTPRANLPRRLSSSGPLRPAFQFGLRVFNYLFKQQREFNGSMLQANREMIFMLATLGDALVESRRMLVQLASRVDGLEAAQQARLEFIEGRVDGLEVAQARLDAIAGRVDGLEVAQARLDPIEGRVDGLEAAQQATQARAEFSHQRVDSAERTLQALSARLDLTPSAVQTRLDLVDALRDVERRLSIAQESLLRNDAILRNELLAQRGPGESPPAASMNRPAPVRPAGENAALHAAIADKFRGDRETIAPRFAPYLADLLEAGTVDDAHPVLDIGSGRGEWLILLRDNGLAAHGAELNELLVSEARISGVDVRYEDGLARLRACPTGSLGAVSAFHVVEHLPFNDLCTLLTEAQRALVPGGLLLLETPDPRNMLVSTRTFYLDPTHRNPIPAELLEFLVASFGYADVVQRELHAAETKAFAEDEGLGSVLNSYFSRGQDYAIIARTPRS